MTTNTPSEQPAIPEGAPWICCGCGGPVNGLHKPCACATASAFRRGSNDHLLTYRDKKIADYVERHGAPQDMGEALARLAGLTVEQPAQAREVARLTSALEEIVQWGRAYPVHAFPEPDLEHAAKVLKENGMTLDAISASNFRHVLAGAVEIATTALNPSQERGEADHGVR